MKVTNPGSPRHEEQLQKLGEFLGLAEIEYVDWGNGEDYVLVRTDGKKIALNIRGNKVDGGFMAVDLRYLD
jgi:hypothetical protein